MAELKDEGLTWAKAQKLVQDRHKWKETIAALCLTRDKEE